MIVEHKIANSIFKICASTRRGQSPHPARSGKSKGLCSKQSGATLTEFLITAPLVLLVGMTTVQAGLIYHGKSTLNYATFEAARTGATHNAQVDMMLQELGVRLAPLQGGDGTDKSAGIAIAKSLLDVQDPLGTQVQVLNPTAAAFDDWGITSSEHHRRVLPNSHLRHRDHQIGNSSGLTLRDANLLKIKVTHGVRMKVPFVNRLISRAMMLVDPQNALYYQRNRFPLTAVATVRMQSDAWEDDIVLASIPPIIEEQLSDGILGEETFVDLTTEAGEPDSDVTGGSFVGEYSGSLNIEYSSSYSDSSGDEDIESVEGFQDDQHGCSGGEYGLGKRANLLDMSDYLADGQCPIDSAAYGPPNSNGGFCLWEGG